MCTGLPYAAAHNYLLSNKGLKLHSRVHLPNRAGELSVQAAVPWFEFRRTKFELAASQICAFFFLFCLFSLTNFRLLSTLFFHCACICSCYRPRSARAPHRWRCKLFNYASCKQQCLSKCALSQCPKHPTAFTL